MRETPVGTAENKTRQKINWQREEKQSIFER